MLALAGQFRQPAASTISLTLRLQRRPHERPATRLNSVLRHTTNSAWDSKLAGTNVFLLVKNSLLAHCKAMCYNCTVVLTCLTCLCQQKFSGSSERGRSGVGGLLAEKIDRDWKQDPRYLTVSPGSN